MFEILNKEKFKFKEYVRAEKMEHKRGIEINIVDHDRWERYCLKERITDALTIIAFWVFLILFLRGVFV